MAGRVPMDRWINDALLDPDKIKANGVDTARCTGLACVHVLTNQPGGPEREVHSVRFAAGQDLDGKKLGALMHGKATIQSQEIPGVSLFALLAFYEENDTPARYPFTIKQAADPMMSAFANTDEGERAQKSMFSIGLLQQVYHRQEAMDRRADRLLDILTNFAERAMVKEQQATELAQTLILDSRLNEQAHEVKMLEKQGSLALRQGLVKHLPPLVNTIANREVFPQNHEDTTLIEMLCEHITGEKLAMLAEGLDPKVALPIMSRVQRYMAQRKEQEALEARTGLVGPPTKAGIRAELGEGGGE